MATLSVSALRKRLADHIATLLSPGQWRQSPLPYDLVPADPGTEAHLKFAIAVLSTEFDSLAESVRHKRGSAGGGVQSTVGVRWTYRIRADAAVADLGDAYDAEAALLKGLTASDHLTDVHISVASMSRRMVGDGTWLMGEVQLVAKHRIDIQ